MKKILSVILILVIISLGIYFWWINGLSAVNPDNKTKKSIVISQGQGIRDIADNLNKSGLIRDPIVFYLLVKKSGVEGKLQAGVFHLSPSQTAENILKELQIGRFDIAITIPEGKRAEEIADLLKQNFSRFNEEWRDLLNQEEGFLFPDTYYLPKDADIDQIISVLKNNFDKKYSEVINNTPFQKNEVVILASLIEREAKNEEDRKLVSSVIHNRLAEGMKLDIDATVQYAIGFDQQEQKWWKKNLTYDDLDIESLYNTYKNPGLPPTPICNPGLASIIAAADPADTDFLFYISDKTGKNHYARTLKEHNSNIENYME